MLPLNALNKKEEGLTLIELMVVVIIAGIAAAAVLPNFIGSLRQNQLNQAFAELKIAIKEAQTNANRLSTSCTVTVDFSPSDEYIISGSPEGCVNERITVNKDFFEMTTTAPGSSPYEIEYDIDGTTTLSDQQTFFIYRINESTGNRIDESGKCLVISNGIGMIRTGIYAPDADADGEPECINEENLRYDNEN